MNDDKIRVIVKLLKIATRNDCTNEVADGITVAAIELLEDEIN